MVFKQMKNKTEVVFICCQRVGFEVLHRQKSWAMHLEQMCETSDVGSLFGDKRGFPYSYCSYSVCSGAKNRN